MIDIAGNYTAEAILFDDNLHFIKDQITNEQLSDKQQFDNHHELAEAYVPIQKMNRIYPPDKALINGTVFPELSRPYCKCECSDKESSALPKFFWEVDAQ